MSDLERRFVCERVLEWGELKTDRLGNGENRLHMCRSRVYSSGFDEHGEPNLKFYDLPPDLKIIPIPDLVLLCSVGKLIKDSEFIFFRLEETESSKKLEDLFESGKVGLVTGGTVDIFCKYRFILLRWNPSTRMFVGFAPNNQDESIAQFRKFLYDLAKLPTPFNHLPTPEEIKEKQEKADAQKALEKARAECMAEVMKLSKAKRAEEARAKQEAERKAQPQGQGKDQPKGQPKDQPKVSPKVQAKSHTRVQSRVQNKAQLAQRKSQVKAQAEAKAKEQAESQAHAKTQEERQSQSGANVQPESYFEAEMHEYPQAAQGHFQAQVQPNTHEYEQMHQAPTQMQENVQMEVRPPFHAQLQDYSNIDAYPQGQVQFQMQEYAPQRDQSRNDEADMHEYAQIQELYRTQNPGEPQVDQTKAHMQNYAELKAFVRAPWEGQMEEYSYMGQAHGHTQELGQTEVPAQTREQAQAQGQLKAQTQLQAYAQAHAAAAARVITCLQKLEEATAQLQAVQGYEGQQPFEEAQRNMFKCRQELAEAEGIAEQYAQAYALAQGQAQAQMKQHQPWGARAQIEEFKQVEAIVRAQAQAPTEGQAQPNPPLQHQAPLTFTNWDWEGN